MIDILHNRNGGLSRSRGWLDSRLRVGRHERNIIRIALFGVDQIGYLQG